MSQYSDFPNEGGEGMDARNAQIRTGDALVVTTRGRQFIVLFTSGKKSYAHTLMHMINDDVLEIAPTGTSGVVNSFDPRTGADLASSVVMEFTHICIICREDEDVSAFAEALVRLGMVEYRVLVLRDEHPQDDAVLPKIVNWICG